MRANEKSFFAKMMVIVAELYGKKISHSLLNLYWAALERFEIADIRGALTMHINNTNVGQFMPKPADIVRYLEGDANDHALGAWSKVESAIRKIGRYDSVTFDDPIIHVVIVDMGGWVKLCGSLIEQMPFLQYDFVKRYRGYLNRKHTHFPKYLMSTLEHSNQVSGYHICISSPVLVGDEENAMAVPSAGKTGSSSSITHESPFILDYLDAELRLKNKGMLNKNERAQN